jgi:selenocysteine lyase/cysteine desulfurase
MVEHPGEFERRDWTPAADARRFECGSPNMLGIHALEASLSLLEEVGMASVEQAINALTARLLELIDHRGFELLSPRAPERRAGIVTFRVPDADPGVLQEKLMAQRVICANRGGGIRFSPHFYTPAEHIERAIELAAELAAGG